MRTKLHKYSTFGRPNVRVIADNLSKAKSFMRNRSYKYIYTVSRSSTIRASNDIYGVKYGIYEFARIGNLYQ